MDATDRNITEWELRLEAREELFDELEERALALGLEWDDDWELLERSEELEVCHV